MRDAFPGYYRPTEQQFDTLWNEGIIALDANVLLNLYRYSPDTRQELFEILRGLSDRLWIPHQAGLEYQRNRLQEIQGKAEAYKEIGDELQDFANKLENKLYHVARPGRHPYVEADKILERVRAVVQDINEELGDLEAAHPDLLRDDSVRDELTSLLDGKVGPEYGSDELDDIYEQGEIRYGNRRPPGYLDDEKEGTAPYGDLVLWFQVIDKARESGRPVILVTDDRKSDWWLKSDRGETLGPRPELGQEITSKAGVLFHMYPADPFMEYASEYLKREVGRAAIEEVRRVRRDQESDFEKKEKMAALALLRARRAAGASLEATEDPERLRRYAPTIEQVEALRKRRERVDEPAAYHRRHRDAVDSVAHILDLSYNEAERVLRDARRCGPAASDLSDVQRHMRRYRSDDESPGGQDPGKQDTE